MFYRVPLVRLVPQDFVDFQELVEAQVTQENLVLLVLQVKHFIYLLCSELQNIAGALYHVYYLFCLQRW
jgi:hypothetical protein